MTALDNAVAPFWSSFNNACLGWAEVRNKEMARSTRSASLDYIRWVLERTRLSASGLAKEAGLSNTTLTRPLNDPEHRFTVTTKTLERIRDATNIDFAPFLAKKMDAVDRTFDRIHGRNYEVGETSSVEPFESIPVMGEVAAGVWREVQFQSQEPLFALPLIPTYREWKLHVIGAVVRGESLNRVARDGDILIIESVAQTGHTPRENDLVLAERSRDQGGIFEVTAKRLVGSKLVPDSDDPRYQEAITIGEHENETMQIIGIVHFVVRRP